MPVFSWGCLLYICSSLNCVQFYLCSLVTCVQLFSWRLCLVEAVFIWSLVHLKPCSFEAMFSWSLHVFSCSLCSVVGEPAKSFVLKYAIKSRTSPFCNFLLKNHLFPHFNKLFCLSRSPFFNRNMDDTGEKALRIDSVASVRPWQPCSSPTS